jgi:hypothetical protein
MLVGSDSATTDTDSGGTFHDSDPIDRVGAADGEACDVMSCRTSGSDVVPCNACENELSDPWSRLLSACGCQQCRAQRETLRNAPPIPSGGASEDLGCATPRSFVCSSCLGSIPQRCTRDRLNDISAGVSAVVDGEISGKGRAGRGAEPAHAETGADADVSNPPCTARWVSSTRLGYTSS